MKKMGKQANICAYVGFTLTLVLAMVGIFAFGLGSHTRTRADSVEAATSGDWTYTVASNKATITAYSGTATDLTIPSTLGGYSVTAIGASGASATFLTNVRTTLTKVTIPASVTEINSSAFSRCTALTTVAYADGKCANLNYYRTSAFYGCTALVDFKFSKGFKQGYESVLSGCTNLQRVGLPIKAYSSTVPFTFGLWGCFNNCTSLREFYLIDYGDNVTKPFHGVDENGVLYRLGYNNNQPYYGVVEIVPNAFNGVNGCFTIPSTVYDFYNYSFFGSKLTKIKIPSNNTNMLKLDYAPINNSNIAAFEVESGNPSLYAIDGVLYGRVSSTQVRLLAYPEKKAGSSFVIPNDVTHVCQNSFMNIEQLTSITIGNSVTNIDYGAFRGTSITSLHIPASVKYINSTSNIFPNTVTTLTVDPANTNFKSENNAIYSKNGETLYFIAPQLTAFSIPDAVKTISDTAFYSSKVANITIPASVSFIGGQSFRGSNSLASVTFMHTSIPTGFTMGGNAFNSISALTTVNLQNRNVYNYFKSHFTSGYFANAPSCFKCLDYTVTLTLNNNGDTSTKLYSWGNGSNYSMYSNANHTTSASSVTVPTRTGYTFDGYWLDKDGDSTQYITKTGTFVSGIADIDADSTLYAHWIPATPLLWSTLGGAAKIYPLDSETGIVRAEVTEAYAGYTFAGWSLNDGTNISSYTVEGGNPKKVVDIPASVLNGKILIASFKQNNTVVDTYANTTHNYLVATTNGGYARILGENASATAVRIRAQTTDPDYKFSHWTLTNLGTGEVTKLLNGMPLTETEDYVSFNCVVPLSMLDGKILTAVFKTTKPSNVNLTINYIPATLPAQSTFSTYIDNTVTAVVFDWFTDDLARSYLVNGTNVISGLTAVNVSTNEFPIYKYLNNSNHTLYFLTMSDVHIMASSDLTFNGKSTLTSIIFKNFDTILMTSMWNMFKDCTNLTTLDLSEFNTSNVNDMRRMFEGCSSLASLDVSSFDTSNVTTMNVMFYGCNKLTYLDLSNFDTSKVTGTYQMFYGCSSLINIDLSSFNTENVTNMQQMFYGCTVLKKLDLSNFNTSSVTTMYAMFYGCKGLTSLNVSSFNTSSVTTMYRMFHGCSSLTSLDLSSFNTAKVTTMSEMFFNLKVTSLDVSNFNTAKCTGMLNMFNSCSNLTSLDLSSFNTGLVTSFSGMFCHDKALESITFGQNFTTANVTSMGSMFYNCNKLHTASFATFNTTKVTSFQSMFYGCDFKTLDLSTFNTSACTSMQDMFAHCTGLETIYVGSGWTHNLTDSGTFTRCNSLKGWYQNGTALASNGFNASNITAEYAKIATSGNGCYLTNINLKSTLESLQSGMLVTGAEFNEILQEYYPKHIIFGNKTTYASAVNGVTGIDVTANGTGQVKYYFVGEQYEGTAYILHETDGTIYANPDCSNMFTETGFRDIDFSNFDTRLMTNMSYMFSNSGGNTYLDISGFDMSHVTNINCAFEETNFTVLYVAANFNVSVSSTNSPFGESGSAYGFYLDNNQLEVNGYRYCDDSSIHACIASSSNEGVFTSVAIKSQVDAMLNNCLTSPIVNIINSNTTRVIFGTKTAYSSAIGNTTGTDVSLLGNGNIKLYYVGTTTYILNENNQTTYCLSISSAFYGRNKITSITWGNLDTRYATSMGYMFYNCTALTSLDLSSFNTKNTLDIRSMFQGCTGLTTLDLSSFVSNKLTNTADMFNGCTNLTTVTFGANFTCNKVTLASRMFYNCTNLVSPGLENFVWSEVIYLHQTFSLCTSLVSLDLGHFIPTSLAGMDSAFSGCTNLGAIFVPSTWNLNLTTSSNVFNNCNNLVGYYPSGATFGQYAYDANYKTSTYAKLPTSTVRGYLTDVQYKNDILVKFPSMIISGQELNVLIKSGTATYSTDNTRFTKIVFGHKEDYTTEVSGIEGIDVSFYQNGNIKLYRVGATAYILHEKNGTILASDCYNMFYGFSKVTDIILDHFDTSQVTDMRQMFYKCSSLTILDLSGFDMSNVTSDKISDMFNECTNLIIIYSANDWTLTYKNSYTHPFDSNNASLRGYYLNNNSLAAYYYSSFSYTYAKVATSTKTGYFTNIALKSQVEAQNFLLPGEKLNLILKGEGVTSYTTNDYTISKIIFGNKSTYSGAVNGVTGVDVSLFHNNSVKLYKVGSVAYILSENGGTIYASNCYYMFSYFKLLNDIDFTNFNTSQCTIMRYMFCQCSSLTRLDLSGFDVSRVEKFAFTFNGCPNLNMIFVSSTWVNNNDGSGQQCFDGDTNLRGYYRENNVVKANAFNSSNYSIAYAEIATSSNGGYLTNVALKSYLADYLVTGVELNALIKAQSYDSEDQTVTKVIFGNKNTYSSAVTNITGVDVTQNKNGNIKLYRAGTTVYILHESNRPIYATSLEYMFYRFSALEDVDFGTLNTSQAISMKYMFSGCVNLEVVYVASTWSAVTGENTFGSGTDSYTTELCGWYSANGMLKVNCFDSNNVSSTYANIATSVNGAYFTNSSLKTQVDAARTRILIDGISFNELIKGTTYNTNDNVITKIVFGNKNTYSSTVYGVTGVDVTVGQTGNVKFYRVGTEIYVLSETNSTIYANKNCSNMFCRFQKMTEIVFGNFDTSLVTDMSGMFDCCEILTSLDLSCFDTSNVTNMSRMFYYCDKPTSLDLSNFDTSNVTDMSYMFYDCNGLLSLDLSCFDTSNVTDMSFMFSGCDKLSSLDVTTFDTSKVTSMQRMFRYCEKLTRLDLSSFDTSNVTDMSNMFEYCSGLLSVDLSSFDTSNVTNISYMFYNCSELITLDLSSFSTSKMTNFSYTFYYCRKLSVIFVNENWSHSSTSSYTFSSCSALKGYYVDNSTLYSNAYSGSYTTAAYAKLAASGNKCYLTNANIKSYFDNQLPIGKLLNSVIKGGSATYDTKDNTITKIVFGNKSTYSTAVSSATGVDVSITGNGQVKLYKVGTEAYILSENGGTIYADKDCSYMFCMFKALSEIVFDNFDTSQVTNMGYMFRTCFSLRSLDLSGFDISKVTNFDSTFGFCYNLGAIYVNSNWNHSRTSSFTFSSCISLKGYYVDSSTLYSNAYNSSYTTAAYAKLAASGNNYYLTNVNLKSQVNNLLSQQKDFLIPGVYFNQTIKGGNVNYDTVDDSITKIVFGNKSTYSTYINGVTGEDVTVGRTGSIKLYKVGTIAYILRETNGTIYVADCSYMFYNFTALTEIVFGNLDTSNVTDMSYMFYGCSGLTSLDVSSFDTTNVIKMMYMFYNCSGLTSLDVSSLDTSNVTHMSSMFYGCSGLTSLDVSSFNTSNLTYMSTMFNGCSGLTSLDVSSFDTSNATDMSGMFSNCSGLTSLDLSSLDTSNVTNMSGMFSNCSGLSSLDLSSFDISKVTNLANTFYKCSSLRVIYVNSNWTHSLTSSSTFYNCTVLKGYYESNSTIYSIAFSTSYTTAAYAKLAASGNKCYLTNVNIKSQVSVLVAQLVVPNDSLMSGTSLNKAIKGGEATYSTTDTTITKIVFGNKSAYSTYINGVTGEDVTVGQTGSIKLYRVGTVAYILKEITGTIYATDCSYMFNKFTALTEIVFGNLDTSNATSMQQMFSSCSGLSSLNLSSLNTSNVTNMYEMFNGCSGLSSLDLSSLNTSNVTSMYEMFYGCSSLTSINLSGLNTSNVTNMGSMFSGCISIASLDISSFDTSKVTNLSYFAGNTYVQVVYVSSLWDKSAVTSSSSAFPSTVKGYYVNNNNEIASYGYNSTFNTYARIATTSTNGYLTDVAIKSRVEAALSSNPDMLLSGTSLNMIIKGTFSSSNNDYTVSKVIFGNKSTYSNIVNGITGMDVTQGHSGRVKLYRVGTEVYILHETNGTIYAPTLCNQIFWNICGMREIVFDNFDTSFVTNMQSMFNGDRSLSSLDLSGFDTSNVTNISYMFSGCTGLVSLDLSSFNVANLATSSNTYIFSSCTNLRVIYTSSDWNISGSSVFSNCSELRGYYLNGNTLAYNAWSTSTTSGAKAKLATSSNGCYFTNVTLKSRITLPTDTDNHILSGPTLKQYFKDDASITKLVFANKSAYSTAVNGVTGVDVSVSMNGKIKMYKSNGTAYFLNETNSTIYALNCENMFSELNYITDIVFENFDTSKITSMSSMFYNSSRLKSLDLSGFDLSLVTSISSMFYNCASLQYIFVSSSWQHSLTSSTTFSSCSKLKGYYLDSNNNLMYNAYNSSMQTAAYAHIADGTNNCYLIDVSIKSNLANFIIDGQSLNKLIKGSTSYSTDDYTITKIVFGNKSTYSAAVAGVTGEDVTISNSGMVKLYRVGTEIYILSENGNTIYAAFDCSYMFSYFRAVTEIVFDNFDTTNVTNMSYMFYYCSSLSSLDISNFDNSNVTTIQYMFNNAPKLYVIFASNKWSKSLSSSSVFSTGTLKGFYLNNDTLSSYVCSNTGGAYAKIATSSVTGYFTDASLKSYFDNYIIGGQSLNALIKGGSATYSTTDTTITKIVFGNKTTYSGAVSSATGVDVSISGNGQVKLYKVGTAAYILSENGNTIYATDCSYMFYYFQALTEIAFDNFDTTNVTNMSYMFYYCSSLSSLDISNFDNSNVTNIQYMFNGASNLSVIFASNKWSKSLSSSYVFSTGTPLAGFYLKNSTLSNYVCSNTGGSYAKIATSSVTGYFTDVSLKSYFDFDNSIIDGVLLNVLIKGGSATYNTVDTTITHIIFGNKTTYSGAVSSATGVDVSATHNGQIKLYKVGTVAYILSENNNTIYAKNCEYMFYYFQALIEIVFDNFDISFVTNMRCMFSGCSSLSVIFVSSNWTHSLTSAATFGACTSLKGYYVSNSKISSNAFNSSYITAEYAHLATSVIKSYFTNISLKSTLDNSIIGGIGINMLIKDSTSHSAIDSTITKVVFGNKTTYSGAVSSATGVDVSLTANGQFKLYKVGTVAYILSENGATIYTVNCDYMFHNFKALTTIVFDNFDVSKLTVMDSTFYNCSSLRVIFVSSNWIHSITTYNTFTGCISLKGYYVSSSAVYSNAFNSSYQSAAYAHLAASGNNCYLTDGSLKSYFANAMISGNQLNTIIKGVDNVSATAYQAADYSITKIIFANKTAYSTAVNGVTGVDVSLLQDGSIKLYKVKSTAYILSENNTTMYAIDCSYMFYNFCALEEIVFTNFNTSKASNMSCMFYNCVKLQSLDLPGFDTSNVIDMSYMFSGCERLINLNVSNFSTSKVTTFAYMFNNCKSMRILNLSNFNTSSVTTMANMFDSCNVLTMVNLSSFNTANVTNMSNMFKSCSQLTTLDLSSFSCASVTDVANMFYQCSALAVIYASSSIWDTAPSGSTDNTFNGSSNIVGYYLNNTNVLNGYTYNGNYIDGSYAVVSTTANRGYFTDVSLRSLVE